MSDLVLWCDWDGNPVDAVTWSKFYEQNYLNRSVGDDQVHGYRVSTVWIGINMNHWGGPPLIFETMVFAATPGAAHDLDCVRYATEAEARAGHAAMVTLIHATTQTVDEVIASEQLRKRHNDALGALQHGLENVVDTMPEIPPKDSE